MAPRASPPAHQCCARLHQSLSQSARAKPASSSGSSQGFFASSSAPADQHRLCQEPAIQCCRLEAVRVRASGFFASSICTPDQHRLQEGIQCCKDWNLSGSKGFFDQASAPQPEAPSKPEPKAEAPKPASSAGSQGFSASSSAAKAPSKPEPKAEALRSLRHPAGAHRASSPAPLHQQTSTDFKKASNAADWKLPGQGSGFFASSTAPQTSTDFKKASSAADWKLSGSKGFFDQASAPQPEAPSKPEPKAESPKPASSAGSQGFSASSTAAKAPSKPQPVSLASSSGSSQGFFASSSAPQTSTDFKNPLHRNAGRLERPVSGHRCHGVLMIASSQLHPRPAQYLHRRCVQC